MACPTLAPPACSRLAGRKIHDDTIQLCSILGQGSYGVVYRAIELATGKEVAVKCMVPSVHVNHEIYQTREMRLHHRVRGHPGVVTMHGVVVEHDFIFMVMEYCSDGDLFHMIVEKEMYVGNDALVKKVFLQLLDATEYCHKMGVYHRDLKPENILCRNGGAEVLIADFGLSTADSWSSEFGCGSPGYMSPENQKTGPYRGFGRYSSQQNDIWSLGIILINLVSGHSPWDLAVAEDYKFRSFLMSSRYLRELFPASDELLRLLKRVFTVNPAHRITIPQFREAIFGMESFTVPDMEDSWGNRYSYSSGPAVVPTHHPLSMTPSQSESEPERVPLPPTKSVYSPRDKSRRNVQLVFIPPPGDFWGSTGGLDMDAFLADSDSSSDSDSDSDDLEWASKSTDSDLDKYKFKKVAPRRLPHPPLVSPEPISNVRIIRMISDPLPPPPPKHTPMAAAKPSPLPPPSPSPLPSPGLLSPPEIISDHSSSSGSDTSSSSSSRSIPRTPEMFAADAADVVFVEGVDALALDQRSGRGSGVDVDRVGVDVDADAKKRDQSHGVQPVKSRFRYFHRKVHVVQA